jgi:hypothetical protein
MHFSLVDITDNPDRNQQENGDRPFSCFHFSKLSAGDSVREGVAHKPFHGFQGCWL